MNKYIAKFADGTCLSGTSFGVKEYAWRVVHPRGDIEWGMNKNRAEAEAAVVRQTLPDTIDAKKREIYASLCKSEIVKVTIGVGKGL